MKFLWGFIFLISTCFEAKASPYWANKHPKYFNINPSTEYSLPNYFEPRVMDEDESINWRLAKRNYRTAYLSSEKTFLSFS